MIDQQKRIRKLKSKVKREKKRNNKLMLTLDDIQHENGYLRKEILSKFIGKFKSNHASCQN